MQEASRATTCQYVDAQVEAHLLREGSVPGSAVRRHIGECSRCGTLYGPLPPDLSATGELERCITARLIDGLKRVRPIPPHRSIVAWFIVLFSLLVLVAVSLTGRPGLAAMTAVQAAGMLGLFGIAAVLFAQSLSWQIAPGSRQRLNPVLVVAIFAVGFLAGAFLLFPTGDPRLWFHMGSECTRSGLLMAIPAGLLISVVVVRGFALSLPMVGATIGGAAGLVAAAGLQIRCNEHTAIHLGFWHGSVVAIAAFVGLLVGVLLGRLRRRTFAGNSA